MTSTVLSHHGLMRGAPTTHHISQNTQAVVNGVYFCDVSSSGLTIALPVNPRQGASFKVVDIYGSAASNNIYIARGTSRIRGQESDYVIDTPRAERTFTYVNQVTGWIVK